MASGSLIPVFLVAFCFTMSFMAEIQEIPDLQHFAHSSVTYPLLWIKDECASIKDFIKVRRLYANSGNFTSYTAQVRTKVLKCYLVEFPFLKMPTI